MVIHGKRRSVGSPKSCHNFYRTHATNFKQTAFKMTKSILIRHLILEALLNWTSNTVSLLQHINVIKC